MARRLRPMSACFARNERARRLPFRRGARACEGRPLGVGRGAEAHVADFGEYEMRDVTRCIRPSIRYKNNGLPVCVRAGPGVGRGGREGRRAHRGPVKL
jgi:hypothetical protein